jgi:small subunit ribosomal protein S3
MIIGKGGTEVDKLKEELKKITDKEIQINIYEVKRPELDAVIVANNIARQVEGKIAYRRATKMAIASTIRMGAEGIKVQVSGRLNGAEMARSEMYKEGRTPLHTFRADIDYAQAEALTKVGLIGIKVWICRGEIYDKRDLAPNFSTNEKFSGGGGRGGERNDRGERRGGGERRERRGDGERRGGGGERRGGGGGDKEKGFRKRKQQS